MTPGENRGIKELRAGPGYGPRAALIHGGADTWRTWCPLVQHLDYSWQVPAFKLPWRIHGHLGLRRHGTLDGWVTDFVTTLGQDLRPDRREFAGRQRFAARCPGFKRRFPLRAAILIAPIYFPRGTTIDAVRAGCRPAVDGVIRETVRDRVKKRTTPPAADVVDSMIRIASNSTLEHSSKTINDTTSLL